MVVHKTTQIPEVETQNATAVTALVHFFVDHLRVRFSFDYTIVRTGIEDSLKIAVFHGHNDSTIKCV